LSDWYSFGTSSRSSGTCYEFFNIFDCHIGCLFNNDCFSRFGLHVEKSSHGTTGKVLNLSHYIAPEELSGVKTRFQQNVYSFGIMLREALMKQILWKGIAPCEKIILLQEPLPPSAETGDKIQIALIHLANECTHLDPLKRPSMDSVSMQLFEINGTRNSL
jgi:hypothetical protein